MDNFTKPDTRMSAGAALELAQKYKNNKNYPYMRELLSVITLDDNNTELLIEWFKNIGLYKDEIINNIVSQNNPMAALTFARLTPDYMEQLFSVMVSNFSPVFAVSWYKYVKYDRNYLLKLRAIELNEVELFIQFMRGGNDPYTMEDFYSDIPDESQLGVVL